MATAAIVVEGVLGATDGADSFGGARALEDGLTLAQRLAEAYRIVLLTSWPVAHVEAWLRRYGRAFIHDVVGPLPDAMGAPPAEMRMLQLARERQGGRRVALYVDADPTACALARRAGVNILLFAEATSHDVPEPVPPTPWEQLR